MYVISDVVNVLSTLPDDDLDQHMNVNECLVRIYSIDCRTNTHIPSLIYVKQNIGIHCIVLG